MAHLSLFFGVFVLIEALRRNNSVTRNAGSKNPRESTMWTLQRLACWDILKEGTKGYRYFRRKKGNRRSSVMDHKNMNNTRRNRTVQSELKPCKCVMDFDLKRRWKMKHRDKTERIINPEMKITVMRSKAELRSGNESVNNMDHSYLFFFFLVLFFGGVCIICVVTYIYMY